LEQVANIRLNAGQSTLDKDIKMASQAALELSSHLKNATNINTGNLDFSKFTASLRECDIQLAGSKNKLDDYVTALVQLGP
jgi:hypothetical protein